MPKFEYVPQEKVKEIEQQQEEEKMKVVDRRKISPEVLEETQEFLKQPGKDKRIEVEKIKEKKEKGELLSQAEAGLLRRFEEGRETQNDETPGEVPEERPKMNSRPEQGEPWMNKEAIIGEVNKKRAQMSESFIDEKVIGDEVEKIRTKEKWRGIDETERVYGGQQTQGQPIKPKNKSWWRRLLGL